MYPRNEVTELNHGMMLRSYIFVGNDMIQLDYRIRFREYSTELYYEIILSNYIAELYPSRNYIVVLYHDIILRNRIIE